jgi:hypothetical protein
MLTVQKAREADKIATPLDFSFFFQMDKTPAATIRCTTVRIIDNHTIFIV